MVKNELKEIPYDNAKDYSIALLKLRSCAFSQVTVSDHLALTHLTYSNYLTQVCFSSQVLYYLKVVASTPSWDPLKLKALLLPHVFGAFDKNAAAFQNLYNKDGL
jgi:hypothetical protein